MIIANQKAAVWRWGPQAPQMPHNNNLDLAVFPKMSKDHSSLLQNYSNKMAPAHEIWSTAQDSDDEEANRIENMAEEQFNVPDGIIHNIGTQTQTTSRWRSALRLLIAFLAGLEIGNVSNRNVTSSSSSSMSSSEQSCGDAATVSYGFLQTTRGITLQETLHQELMFQSPKVALQHMQLLMDEEDQIANTCHPLTHMLGRNALMELGFDEAWGGMVGTPDVPLLRICSAAYMHGIIENYLVAPN
jgi:hypothetical protein